MRWSPWSSLISVVAAHGLPLKCWTLAATTNPVRGAPAWSPDGRWVAVSANRDGEPRLFKIPVDGGTPASLVNEYSTDATWAPSGQFLVYSGADVGTTFSVKAVSADGAPRPMPNLILTRGARRLAFLDDNTLVIMKGDLSYKDFWSVDLTTGHERQLTRLRRGLAIGDFDISLDRREIIFDRTREKSDIVLFDLSAPQMAADNERRR
jgi:Tol biopolymer transport system component